MDNRYNKFFSKKIAFSLTVFSSITTYAANFSVTHNEDGGPGSLKAVLGSVNALPGEHQVTLWPNNPTPHYQEALPALRRDVTFVTPKNVFGINQELKGTANLTKKGNGTLVLEAPNSLVGNVSILEGTLEFKNSNTYSGKTLIQNGTAVAHTAGSFSRGPLAVSQNGTIQAAASLDLANSLSIEENAQAMLDTGVNTVTFTGAISGKGKLVKLGNGSLFLKENNVHKGGIEVQAGNLVIGSDENLGHVFSPLNLGNGALVVDQDVALHMLRKVAVTSENSSIQTGEHNLKIASAITGTGSLHKRGKGTLSLISNHNDYAGKTTLHEGVLEVMSSANLGKSGLIIEEGVLKCLQKTIFPSDFAINVEGASSTIDTGDNAIEVHSKIEGGGSLNKEGTGKLVLQGENAYSGATSIKSGTLVVNGKAGAVSVHQGAQLKGNGRVDSVNSSGSISPGNSIGTLQVVGDLNLASSSILYNEVSASGLTDQILVGGVANLSGKVAIIPERGMYQDGTHYTFLMANGGLNGAFQTLAAPAQFQGELTYQPHSVAYQLDHFLSLTEFLPEKEGDIYNTAAALDQILAPPGSDMDNIMAALLGLRDSPEVLQEAIDQLQPAHFSALGLSQQYNMLTFRSSLFNRFQEFISFPCAHLWNSEKPWSLWSTTTGDFNRQNKINDCRGYHSNTIEEIIGVDKTLNSRWRLGIAGGYSHSNVHWEKAISQGYINSYYGSLYGLYRLNRWFVEGSFIGSFNHYHATRKISFSSIYRKATHENDGHSLSGEIGFGYVLPIKKWQMQPYFVGNYLYSHQGAFSEKGAGSLDLVVKEKDFAMVRAEVGLDFSTCMTFDSGSLSPEIRLSYIYEGQLKTADFNVHYKDDTTQYIVEGMKPVRNLFAPAVGFKSLFFDNSFSFSLYYNTEIGSKFWDQRISGRLGYNW